LPVAGDDGETLDLSLGNEYTIEGIAVVEGQCSGVPGVPKRNGQRLEPAHLDFLEPIVRRGEFPKIHLCGDLPDARGTNEYLGGFVSQRFTSWSREVRIISHPPKQGMSVN
jgi:hypothetical protein